MEIHAAVLEIWLSMHEKVLKLGENEQSYARNTWTGYHNAKILVLHYHWTESFHMVYETQKSM